MRKGISPIVAVVLLIAIAVVAAVGLYFWAGGIATHQNTPSTPIAITATPIDPANGKIAVANLGDTPLTVSRLNTADGTYCEFGEVVTIQPNQQAVCTMPPKRGTTILYGSNVSQAVVILPSGDIAETTIQTDGFETSTWLQTTEGDFDAGSYTNTSHGSPQVVLAQAPWINRQVGVGNSSGVDLTTQTIDLAEDSNRIVHVVWYANIGGNIDIYYANSSNWTQNVRITSDVNDQRDPTITIDPNDVVHIVWSDRRNPQAEVYYANSSDNWAEQQLITAAGGLYNPVIKSDSNGILHLAYFNTTAVWKELMYTNSTDYAKYTLIDNTLDKLYLVGVMDSSDTLHLVWVERTGGTPNDDWNVTYSNSSNWANVQLVTPTDNSSKEAVYGGFAVDSSGVAHVAWSANYGGGGPTYYGNSSDNWIPTTISASAVDAGVGFNSTGDVFVAFEDGGLKYTSVSDLNPITITTSSTSLSPKLFSDSNGVSHIVWYNSWGDGNYSVYYANSDDDYVTSGTYLSSILDTTYTYANFTEFSWTKDEPAGTNFSINLMFSNNSDFSGAVVEDVTNPDTTFSYVARYARYNVSFESGYAALTPSLYDVNLDYRAINGNLTYTVNSDSALSWVALNKTCGATTTTPYNEPASGTFYSKTVSVPTDCSYRVWGPGLSNSTTYP